MVVKLSKIVSFLQFFVDVNKQITIYVYASETSRFALLENGIGYYATASSLKDISVSTNWQKCTILGNLRTVTQERKKETRQKTPFFHLFFKL